MNLFFVTDVYPYPPRHGSAVISFHWMRQLAPQHSISLASLERPADDEAANMIEGLGITTLQPPSGHPMRFASIRGTLSMSPVSFARFDGRLWRGWLQTHMREDSTDVLVVIGPALASLFHSTDQWPCPVLFVPYDSVSFNLGERLRRFAHSQNWGIKSRFPENPLKLAHYFIEYRKWAGVEKHLYVRPQACVAVTSRDAEAISARWAPKVKQRLHVIPNGVNLSDFRPSSDMQVEGRMVFTGSMSSIESMASAMWFLKSVFPSVKRALPEATLDIVGKDPPLALQRLASSLPGVRVTGYVPDLRPYLAAASVYVCPLLLGSGIKNRLLEALAMGKAVVATSTSCHGLKVDHRRELIMADDAASFQQEVIDLLENSQRRVALGVAARSAVEEYHSWEAVGERVERLLATLSVAGKVL